MWERCKLALPANDIYNATDHQPIAHHCDALGTQYVITSPDCLTGTDRVRKARINLLNISEIQLVEPDAPDRPLTLEQENGLIRELVPHAREPVGFLLTIAQRLNNCLTIDWKQIDLQGRTMLFKVKSKRFKNGRNVRVPINEDILLMLVRLGPKKSGPVFTYDPERCSCVSCKRFSGQQIGDIRKAFKAALRRAGISRDFRIHDLRHTAGSRILALTGDLKAAQDYLGHANIKSTMRYEKHDVRKKMEIQDQLTQFGDKSPALFKSEKLQWQLSH